jgi:hypothetical protein
VTRFLARRCTEPRFGPSLSGALPCLSGVQMSLPGLAALTLIGVSGSSLAYMAVSMLGAALDDGYCAEAGSSG